MSREGSASTSRGGEERVWDAFDRGSPAGRALFKLYSKDFGGKEAGNRFSQQRNRQKYEKAVSTGAIVPQLGAGDVAQRNDPSKWGKNDEVKPQAKVRVPVVWGASQQVDRFENPGRPGHGGGKRPEAVILEERNKLEMEIRSTKPLPRREMIGEKEKIRFARKQEFNGHPPEENPDFAPMTRAAPVREPSRVERLEQLFDDLTGEIEERHQFLTDMEKMGQRAKYEVQIMGEVSSRLTQLKKLDVEIKKAHYMREYQK